MSHKVLLILCACLILGIPLMTHAQDRVDVRRWSADPRSTALHFEGIPPVPSQVQATLAPRPTVPRVFPSPAGILTVYPNLRVHPSTTVWQSEVPITRHPTNGNILYGSSNAVSFSPSTFISEGMYLTTDGGTTWFGSDTTNAATLSSHSGDPAPAITPNGDIYNSYLYGGGVGVAKSTNMGSVWTTTTVLTSASSDKNHTFVDDVSGSPYYGRIYVTWSDFSASLPNTVVSYSSNTGSSWSSVITAHTATGSNYDQGVNGAVGLGGVAYIAWQSPMAGSPYTGQFIGLAKSTNGGATWTATNNIYACNGIRGNLTTKASIRVNDFPSMTIDKSGGARNGWMYIVTAEQSLSPAGSDPDIVMHRSTDGGTTWSAGIRVNQDAINNGKIQYMPWMCVDETGALNVIYYDDRTTTTDSASVFVSRSNDGGNTWTDVEVADHHFKPAPISGLASGYQGDYIGITYGNGKVFPYWTDNSTGLYQAWVAKMTTTVNYGWVKGTITNVSGGAALNAVAVDFSDAAYFVNGTTDAAGFYKVGALVDTPATTHAYTLRARKFGFRDTLVGVTLTRGDTLTRSFAMTPVPSGTLVVRTVRRDSTNIRSAITVYYNSNVVATGYTDSLTGIYTTSLPYGTYDIVADPPSPYGTKRTTNFAIGGGTNALYLVVRAVIENSPAAVRDTLAVNQVHAKILQLTNTTSADTVTYRLGDDNAALKFTKPAVQPRAIPITLPERPKGAAEPMGPAQVDSSGGPDTFGYRWIDSDSPGGPVFNWFNIDTTGRGTAITFSSLDDGNTSVPLSIPIPFYGNSYSTSLNVCTNGWVSFTSTSTAYSNVAIPATSEPNNAIYGFWDDLNLTSGGSVKYYYDAAGTRFIVQYTNVPFYTGTGTNTFQIQLYPNGQIIVQYLSMTGTNTSVTAGIENADGTVGLQVLYNGTYIHNNLAVKYYLPDAAWISENPTYGRINPGATQNITVTFDATGLQTGTTYNGKLVLDVTHPDVTGSTLIPASLKVNPASGPVIMLTRTSVSFPVTEIGTSRRDSLVVRNGGSASLVLSSITSSSLRFTVTPSSGTVPVGDSLRVRVTYLATAPAHSDTGRIIILSNDPLAGRSDVALSGSSFGVAHMIARPDTFYFNIAAGNDTTRTPFRIVNPGSDTLRYSIIESLGANGKTRSVERSMTQQSVPVRAKGAPDTEPGQSSIDAQGGPDAFGYRWIDSDDPGGPSFEWNDILSVGTQLTGWSPSSDDGNVNVTLPWAFSFYGTSYTSMTVCTNGWISFVSTTTEYSNSAIPTTTTPNGAIYGLWDDLNLSTSGTVHYYNDIANQRFVVQYTNVPFYSGTGTATFQIILYRDGSIRTLYRSVVGQLTSCTIGVENQAGTVGLQVVYNAAYLHDALAIVFSTDLLSWMSTDRITGTVAPGDSQSVQLRIHPAGLATGVYTGYQRITGNTTDTARVRVRLNTNTANGVTVTSPNGGETWYIGQSYPITWSKTGSVDSVKIEYSTTGSSGTWTQITGGVPAGAGGASNPTGTFNWTVPAGTASLNCYVRVSWKSNTAIYDVSDVAFTIQQPSSTDTTLYIPIQGGWNIVSNPLTNPVPGDSLRQLFPHALGNGFYFQNGYVQALRLGNGKGYWVKFPAAETDTMHGTIRLRDSISVQAGWNVVGSISRTIDTNTIVTIPAGNKVSNWYAYNGGYTLAIQILPARGYWVKVNGAGKFVFANPAAAVQSGGENGAGDATTLLNSITITDNAGNGQTLYFGVDEVGRIVPSSYLMPPLPPAGGFDARFESAEGGSMIALHAQNGAEGALFPIAIQDATYPLTVSWKVHHGKAVYELVDGSENPHFRTRSIAGDGSFVIPDDGVTRLSVRLADNGAIPSSFGLAQNYPNPFNPATTIRYALPVDAHVTLTVFDVLGRTVAVLVNEAQVAGFKSVPFDARVLASGTYFYRLQAGSFTSTKKLLILK
jgi:hypothetical protein